MARGTTHTHSSPSLDRAISLSRPGEEGGGQGDDQSFSNAGYCVLFCFLGFIILEKRGGERDGTRNDTRAVGEGERGSSSPSAAGAGGFFLVRSLLLVFFIAPPCRGKKV